MADDEHLIHILLQSGGDAIAKLGHARLEAGRICPAPPRGIGKIMHQIIGEKPAILALEPIQNAPKGQGAQGRSRKGNRVDKRRVLRIHGKGESDQIAEHHRARENPVSDQ